MKKLSECTKGDTVTIQKISGVGAFKRRLIEMGFMKGTQLTIIKYAPLKDPMELTLRNFHVCLRVSEAQEIFVE